MIWNKFNLVKAHSLLNDIFSFTVYAQIIDKYATNSRSSPRTSAPHHINVDSNEWGFYVSPSKPECGVNYASIAKSMSEVTRHIYEVWDRMHKDCKFKG